jgi:protein-disulfide isomerase
MVYRSPTLLTRGSTRAAAALAVLILASLTALATTAAAKTPALETPSGESSGRTVIATVGSERITEADVIAQDQDEFDKLQADNELRLHQLQLKQAEARYGLLKKQMDRLLDRKALELEAKARGSTTDTVLADLKVSAVTEDEARAYFDANKARAGTKTFEQLQPEITQYLADRHNTEATRSFYDSLRAKHATTSLLSPFRVAAAATGPARGKEQAPVTIVEFGDFQCPYCRQAEDAVRIIMGMHPDDVRLVFRELPLPTIHANAMGAAEAAICADRQGMFWPMHDAMYEDQTALGEAALKETAKRIGLNVDSFSACLLDAGTAHSIEADAKAADELNITGTPFFLINGRPLYGNVPVDQLESIVSDELHRVAPKRG